MTDPDHPAPPEPRGRALSAERLAQIAVRVVAEHANGGRCEWCPPDAKGPRDCPRWTALYPALTPPQAGLSG